MRALPTLVIFQPAVCEQSTPLERLVTGAQSAAALDLLAVAAESETFRRAILVTEDQALGASALAESSARLPMLPLVVDRPPGGAFHFGAALSAICKAHALERVVYVGGGALPLATAGQLRDLALAVSGESPCVVSNNLFSADLVAFYPASALDLVVLPSTDNDLAWLLHYRAGLPHATTPRHLSMQFDIDTPPDLATLWQATQSQGAASIASLSAGPHLTRALAEVPAAVPRLAEAVGRAYGVMATRRAQVLLAGRVSAWIWRRLEVNLPCQTRVFSEERGMQASGREARGEVRSLLGLYVDRAGIEGLFDALTQVCDAAFIDTRVLFAHRRLVVSKADRFASDALQAAEIANPWVRELTAAAASAPIPVVLGGHSLITGGVWALSERVRASGSVSAG